MNPAPRRRGGGRRRGAGRPARPRIDVEPLKPTAEPPDVQNFKHWPLHEDVQSAIAGMDIVKPTPIQSLAIGPVLEGKDVIAKAETGTGKTLAFGAPMISKVDPARRTVLGLVLSPTRELAEQVHSVLEQLGAAREMRTALIVGGEDMVPQVKALQAGAQVVVGTPGRVLDLMGQGFLSFPWTEFVVLDEADKMLEIGFIDDVKKILDAANEYRQTLLFSATFPPALLELARGYTTDPAEIATASGHSTVDTISQRYISVDEDEKADLLGALIERSGEGDVFLVFCDRRTDVDRLLRRMERRRFPVKALHGGYDQAARFRVMTAFRQKEVKALLATDVASRGLDVVHVTHVINFGVPRDAADYTHRIGRTGRAGRQGIAITLVSPSDRRRWVALRNGTPFEIEEGHTTRELLKAPDPKEPEEVTGEEQLEEQSGSGSGERGERPRRERSGRGSGERGERPRRERSGRGSGERGERPRRERSGRGSGERGERPRRERSGSGSGERGERPHRERSGSGSGEGSKQDSAGPGGQGQPAGGSEAATSFGQGLQQPPSPRRASKPRPAEPKPQQEEPPSSAPSGGFGAGV